MWNVILSELMTDTVFVFPKERFVEYDESDIWWLSKYGLGYYKQVPSKKIYTIGGSDIMMHPETFNAIKAELENRDKLFKEKLYEM